MPLKRRPFGVTLFIWMVLSLSAWGAVRFLATLRWWDVLTRFDASLSPVYLSVTGAGWVVAGGVLFVSLLRIKPWARLAVFISILLWLTEYWLERLLVEAPRANLPFTLTGSIVILLVATTITFRQSTRLFFIRNEEHEQPEENPKSE